LDNLTLAERGEHYRKTFPQWEESWPHTTDRWLWATWLLGSSYKGSGFYGSFPHGLLKRMMSMFPDASRVLHIFSGSLPHSEHYTRFDMVQDADVMGNAEELSKHFKPDSFDLIIADPPYHAEAAKKYETPMPNRLKVIRECHKVLEPGGYLLWLDTMLPMFRKAEFEWCVSIGIFGSTNHRVRGLTGFRRKVVEEGLPIGGSFSGAIEAKLFEAQEKALKDGSVYYVYTTRAGKLQIRSAGKGLPKGHSGQYVEVDSRAAQGYASHPGGSRAARRWHFSRNSKRLIEQRKVD